MKRLRKLATLEIDDKYGTIISLYTDSEYEAGISYSEGSKSFYLFMPPDINTPQAYPVNSDMKEAFESAEEDLITEAGDIHALNKTIVKNIGYPDVDNGLFWREHYNPAKATSEELEDKNQMQSPEPMKGYDDDGNRIIEFKFNAKDEKAITEEFINRAILDNVIKYYNILPLKSASLRKFKQTIAFLKKLFPMKRLAYLYTKVLEDMENNLVQEFGNFVTNVVAVYFKAPEIEDEYADALSFIVEYNGRFIAFGPNCEQEIQNKSLKDNNKRTLMILESFIEELENGTYNGIYLFDDFYKAEEWVLGTNSNNIQSRIITGGYKQYEDNDTIWDNYINSNYPESMETDETKKDETKEELLRLRIQFKDTKANENYINNWIYNNMERFNLDSYNPQIASL